MKERTIKLDFGRVGTGRKDTTSRIYNNPLIKLVRLLKGTFTFDESYCYITIPFEEFYKYLETWEKIYGKVQNKKNVKWKYR